MLFRASSIVLLVLCLNFLWGLRPLDYALTALLTIWTVLSIRGVASMRSRIFGHVYWRGDGTKKTVALTFDDGPGPHTPEILDILARHGVKATFFVIGGNLKKYPDAAARMRGEGHELGNHTQSHPRVFRMLFQRIREDIEDCQGEIERAAGYRPRFFRQPVGLNNPSVMKVIDGMGMVMVGWQVRAYDGVKARKKGITARILKGVRPGGIILLHDGCDGHAACDRTPTVEALREIIPALKERGYGFKTVSEILRMENIQGPVKPENWI